MKKLTLLAAVACSAGCLVLGLTRSAVAERPKFGPSLLVLNATTSHVQSRPDWAPRVVTSDDDMWLAVWHSDDTLNSRIGHDNDILVARSGDKGRTWSKAVALNANATDDSGDDRFPSVATDGKGGWIAVWQSDDALGGRLRTDLDILYVRSIDGGKTWSRPAPLAANATDDWGTDEEPQIASDGKGTWICVWTSTDALGNTIGGDRDILYARSTDLGRTWTAPLPLVETAKFDSGFDISPRIVSGSDSTWLVAWDSSDPLGGRLGRDKDILYTRSLDSGLTWASATELNTNAATDSFGDREPQLATDGKGGWVAVWTSTDPLGDTVGKDADIFVASSKDNGANWSAPRALAGYATRDARDDSAPQVAADGLGGWLVVWNSWHPLAPPDMDVDGLAYDLYQAGAGPDADVFVCHSENVGETWTSPTMISKIARTDEAEDLRPFATTDGKGNWIVIWESVNRTGALTNIDWGILAAVGYVAPRASKR